MKGTHLARVARAQGAGVRLPLDGVRCETVFLDAPSSLDLPCQTVLVALEGEVVVDLANDFVHLRQGEAVTLAVGTVRLSPVNQAVLLRVSDHA